MVWLAKKISLSVLILLGFLLLAFLIAPYLLPRVGEESDIQVQKLPESYQNKKNSPPYPMQGQQLALKTESFPFPIRMGETGPAQDNFNMPLQYPFYCGKNISTARQPQVDNQKGIGVPVYKVKPDETLSKKVIGYSQNCLHPTRVEYYYNRKDTERFFPLEEANQDINQILVNGKKVDFIVRLETGTINRFLYAMAALKGPAENINNPTSNPDGSYWNKRLIYQFRGGVGIGKRQGNLKSKDVLERRFDELRQGYAVVYSSGNQTSNHYNIRLAEDTARRVKKQFTSLYGSPEYTVGIGGSGGAIQQYLIAQNSDDILDAILPLYSYPDMVTQIIHILDCELLEYYMDIFDSKNTLWEEADAKQHVIGLHSNDSLEETGYYLSRAGAFMRGKFNTREGSTECIQSWRGLTPLVNNPRFYHHEGRYKKMVREKTNWTHWDDLKFFYGTDEHGFANPTWDNVGIQYGLEALREGFLSPQQFLHLNQHIGGWKSQKAQDEENFWALNGSTSVSTFSPWGHHNMTHFRISKSAIAPRTQGNEKAIQAIINSGHVFTGEVDVPIIDIRHYLEEELDMHHLLASFSTRVRMQHAGRNIHNQPIWVSHQGFNPVTRGFAVIDQWMANIKKFPYRTLAENRPQEASDSCFDEKGATIAQGNNVWDGWWNKQRTGTCLKQYPAYKTSRIVAGGNIAGNLFKCNLMSVEEAIQQNIYNPIEMTAWQKQLEETFPEGVCDYRHQK